MAHLCRVKPYIHKGSYAIFFHIFRLEMFFPETRFDLLHIIKNLTRDFFLHRWKKNKDICTCFFLILTCLDLSYFEFLIIILCPVFSWRKFWLCTFSSKGMLPSMASVVEFYIINGFNNSCCQKRNTPILKEYNFSHSKLPLFLDYNSSLWPIKYNW